MSCNILMSYRSFFLGDKDTSFLISYIYIFFSDRRRWLYLPHPSRKCFSINFFLFYSPGTQLHIEYTIALAVQKEVCARYLKTCNKLQSWVLYSILSLIFFYNYMHTNMHTLTHAYIHLFFSFFFLNLYLCIHKLCTFTKYD